MRKYLDTFLDKYCDYQSNYIRADFANRKQMFLAHLLNLYNASLINSQELLEYKLDMDQRLPATL